jgi:hypothetical protein
MIRHAHIVISIVIAVILAYVVQTLWPVAPAFNPDPNHNHADFAVWVNGKELDFSADQYMSGSSTDASTHPESGPRQYLHLHDGNGHVIHRHKPGMTLGNFFSSIGFNMTDTCLTLDDTQFKALDAGWVKDFARTKKLCNDGKFHWTFVVNGKEVPMEAGYVFADEDAILLSYSASDTAWQDEWKAMTDDACLYSKTCPWRGRPPTEGCIADPTVPCKE